MAEFNIARIRYTWKDYWTGATSYTKDDVVRVGGNTYICMIGHTSDPTDFPTDLNYSPKSRWLLHTEGYTWRNEWQAVTRYNKNDLVKYGAVIYRVLTEHVSGNTSIAGDESKLIVYYKTPNWRNEWLPLTTYKIDDVIRYGGYVYKCITEHTSSTTLGGLETDQVNWEIKWRGDSWNKDWTVNTRYFKDDIVRYGGFVYRCITGHSSAGTTVLGLENDQAKWEIVISGIVYKGTWQSSDDSSGTRYKVGDIITYGPTLWRCKTAHTTTNTFIEANFDIWMPGLGFEGLWDTSVAYQPGDIVQYGGYTYTSMTNNTASAPSVTGVFYDGESLQGTYDWELLTTGYSMKSEWEIGLSYRTGDVVRRRGWVYIAVKDSVGQEPDALDPELRSYYDPGSSASPDNTPTYWQVVTTGDYYTGEWVDSAGTIYSLGDIVVHKSTAWVCKQRHEADDSTLVEPDLDSTNSYWEKHIQGSPGNVLQYKGDLRTHDGSNHTRLAIGSPGGALKVNASVNPAWEGLGEVAKVYFVSTSGKDAPGNGLSISAPFKSMKYACQYILADEANRAPGTIFVSTGVYEEILPISIPAGITVWGDERRSVTIKPAAGSEGLNMWLLRNATGIKNMTFMGLTGNLGPADVYGTKRPQGGAYMSFDPGSGPDDQNVWITTKSPYCQNISSFGQGVTGLRLNGSLHNGGLKSMVANDVTNFLDDGISVWLSGDSRAELVSVFTYFCHIGYLCTDGGKIRGTNGNNSYGTFGSAALGTLASETPITAKVHNQYYGANAPEVYNNADNIFAIAYTHSGQDYVNAQFTISGSGTNVSTDNTVTETRQGGISEIRLKDSGDSTLPGGRGFLTGIRNSAQSGTTTNITIAQSDINDASHYAGRAYLTFDNISVAAAQRPAGTYSIAPATTNGRGYVPQQAFSITIDETGAATSIVPLAGSHSHRVGDTITVSDVNLGNQGGPVLTFNVASVSEGQRIYIEQGKGRGQYGIVDEYFPATKLINVLRESDGKRGWDHIVPGWTISTVLDGTTTYRIEPRVKVTTPTYTTSVMNTGVTSTWRTATGHGETLIAFTDSSEKILHSNLTGAVWTAGSKDANWVDPNCAIKCKGKLKYYIAVGSGGYVNLSTTGTAWGSTPYVVPVANYVAVVEGPHTTTSHTVIAIADDSSTIQKSTTDGTTWTSIVTGADSTVGFKWLAYGNGKWMIVRADGSCLQSIDNGETWVAGNNVCPSTYDVTGFTWGNNRFVATCKPNGTFSIGANVDPSTTMISDATSTTSATFGLSSTFFFSFTDFSTGATSSVWYESDNSNILDTDDWSVAYNDGVFVANSNTGKIRTSDGGHVWMSQANITPGTALKPIVTFRTDVGPKWWILDTNSQPTITLLRYGATAKMRVTTDTGRISQVLTTEPGSGYDSAIPPIVYFYDTQKTLEPTISVRVNNGVLGQPIFKNRGGGYTKFNQVEITGDGFADQFQTGLHFIVKDLSLLPGPGDNLTFTSINDLIYKVGSVETLSGVAPNITAKISLAPTMGNAESPVHEEDIVIRQYYSQVRLTGHDFLDVGTGTTTTTNYPTLYTEGYSSVYPPEQPNETIEYAGGRVFYTSTDQDGNFRVGELFKVEQSTGVVTINASQFDLKGLTELRLGAIIVGGTQAVIREFSKENTFVANSNNIVPTQRAIASYITSRISGGGSNVSANAVLAGTVKLSNLNQISNTGGLVVDVPVLVNMKGGVSGSILASAYFNNGISAGMQMNQELYEDPEGHYDNFDHQNPHG